jgi:hypothetical protein
MTEHELVLRQLLGSLVPNRAETPEWDDVLRRARVERTRATRRRALAVALVAVALAGLAMSPLGTAIADGVGGFTDWIRGEPGVPATPTEQQAFERANERTWVKFAAGTQLRRLVSTEVSGTRFTLYGFRSGDDLCLRLTARGKASETSTYCAPLRVLQTDPAPAVVVATDEGIGSSHEKPNEDGFVAPAYSATFGIASDGVRKVSLRDDDGAHEALLGGNAFLYVADRPHLGTRVRSAEGVAANGARAELPLQAAPFGYFDLPAPPNGQAPGPTEVERTVEGGSIEWVERGERRGDRLPRNRIGRPFLYAAEGARQQVLLARAIQPDPKDYLRIGVVALSRGDSLADRGSVICTLTIDRNGGGGGCSRADHLFDRWPFTWSSSSSGAGQYSVLAGLASDDVARLELFSARGDPVRVPLRDNAWLARVAGRDYPLRLVAYDDEGRVIGIHAEQSNGNTSPAPAEAKSSVRNLARVAGESGQTATLRAGTVVGGYRCYRLEVSNRGGGGGCTRWPVGGQPLAFVEGAATHGDVFFTGPLPPATATVSLSYPNGESSEAEPIGGFLVYAVPHRFITGPPFKVTLRAFDRQGNRLDERAIEVTR